MALDVGNLLPTPDNYATPGQIKAQQDYAAALLHGSGQQQPIRSWTQGVSNMVSALMGGNIMNRANNQQLASMGQDATAMGQPAAAQGQKPPFNEGPSSEGREKADGGSLDREADAIASIESKGSGDYSAIGRPTHTGDKAYGKYQVMGANVGPWTREVLGREMLPEEFLRDPAAQDAVFKAKFAQGGNNDADRASTWFTGKPLAQGANRSDGNITGAQYVNKFEHAMGQPSATAPAMAFAGAAGPADAPAAKAIDEATQGQGPQQVAQNTQVAGKTPPVGVQAPMPTPNGSGTYVDPRLVQRRPQYSPDQIHQILQSPWLTEGARLQFLQAYQQQNQPIEVPYPGGKVLIDPMNPTKQQFIPDLQKGTTKAGDIEVPSYGTVAPQGATGPGMQFNRINPQAVGPQSQATPTATPASAPPAPTGGPAVAAAAPPQAPPQAPVKVASLDPTAGIAQVGAPPAAGAQPAFPAPQEAQAGPPGPLHQLAAGDDALKNLLGPEAWEMYQQKKAYDQNQAVQQHQRETDIDLSKAVTQHQKEADIDVDKTAKTQNSALAAKRYDNMQAATQSAYHQLDNLRTAQRQLDDPAFYSGLFANEVEGVKKLGQLLGGDPNSSKPMEVFRKTMASQISDGLKAAYGGLGQIRNKEIELSEKANGSLSTSLPANLALVEIAKRNATRLAQLGEMGTDYRLGHEVVDPISGETMVPANVGPNGDIVPRVGLDPGYDKAANTFVKNHPMFSPEEYKNFGSLFDKGAQAKAGEKAAGAPGGTPQKVTEDEWKKLPVGTPYVAPDGNTYIKK